MGLKWSLIIKFSGLKSLSKKHMKILLPNIAKVLNKYSIRLILVNIPYYSFCFHYYLSYYYITLNTLFLDATFL
mgnify:CR=1 FL=1